MINAESGRLTNKITDHSNPRHKSYGLFQISSMDYCTPSKKGGNCQAKCEGSITFMKFHLQFIA